MLITIKVIKEFVENSPSSWCPWKHGKILGIQLFMWIWHAEVKKKINCSSFYYFWWDWSQDDLILVGEETINIITLACIFNFQLYMNSSLLHSTKDVMSEKSISFQKQIIFFKDDAVSRLFRQIISFYCCPKRNQKHKWKKQTIALPKQMIVK